MTTTPTTQIRDRWNGALLFAAEAADIRGAVTKAVAAGAYLTGANLAGADLAVAYLARANLARADLAGADLAGAYLTGANLTGANLAGANLTGAYLAGAYLAKADLTGADLAGANLTGAYLTGANLTGANLTGAYLTGANLARANLTGAKIDWNSHDLVAEMLRREAGADVEKRKIAGLVLVSSDRCWNGWLELRADPLFGWALDTLAASVRPGDNAPQVLRRRAEELAGAGSDAASLAATPTRGA
jgi:hypothetical protein